MGLLLGGVWWWVASAGVCWVCVCVGGGGGGIDGLVRWVGAGLLTLKFNMHMVTQPFIKINMLYEAYICNMIHSLKSTCYIGKMIIPVSMHLMHIYFS